MLLLTWRIASENVDPKISKKNMFKFFKPAPGENVFFNFFLKLKVKNNLASFGSIQKKIISNFIFGDNSLK